MPMLCLTPKRERFIVEYLSDLNATKAAERAGYKHPNVQGSQLLAMPIVSEHIQSELENRSERLRVNSDWVVMRLEAEAIDLNNAASVRVKALELLGKHLGLFSCDATTKDASAEFCFADA